jgi:hypothetical protein
VICNSVINSLLNSSFLARNMPDISSERFVPEGNESCELRGGRDESCTVNHLSGMNQDDSKNFNTSDPSPVTLIKPFSNRSALMFEHH